MLLDLFNACPTKTLDWFSLKQFVDEVGSLDRPSFRNILLFDQYLLFLNFLFNLLAILSQIGSFSYHYFIQDDPKSIKVNFVSMIMMKHNLRSHIARSSTSVLSIGRS